MVSLSAADKTSQLKKDQILKCCHAPHTSAKGKKKSLKLLKKKKRLHKCVKQPWHVYRLYSFFFFCRPYNKRQMKHCNSVSQHKEAKNRRTKLELEVYELRVNIAPSITAPSRSQEDSRSYAICLFGFNTIFPTKQNRSIFFYYRQKYHCCWI